MHVYTNIRGRSSSRFSLDRVHGVVSQVLHDPVTESGEGQRTCHEHKDDKSIAPTATPTAAAAAAAAKEACQRVYDACPRDLFLGAQCNVHRDFVFIMQDYTYFDNQKYHNP